MSGPISTVRWRREKIAALPPAVRKGSALRLFFYISQLSGRVSARRTRTESQGASPLPRGEGSGVSTFLTVAGLAWEPNIGCLLIKVEALCLSGPVGR